MLASMFPSPCGEMGIRNDFECKDPSCLEAKMFPSPCGEMGIRNMKSGEIVMIEEIVMFPSPCGEMGIRNFVQLQPLRRHHGFRPLAGKWV